MGKGRDLAAKSDWLTQGCSVGSGGGHAWKEGLSLFMEAVKARPRSVALALWTVGPIKGKQGGEVHGHFAAAYRSLRLRAQPGTPASQGDELRKGSLCHCALPGARWPKAELEPSA